MTDLEPLVLRAQAGDIAAFTRLVHLFQDMAVGYGYSLLRDFHRAEDAAQEAFIEAYYNLPKLREADSFPSWFRKIVFKHCDRLTRRKAALIVPLGSAPNIPCPNTVPLDDLERQELHQAVLAAIRMLPERERIATTLFHIGTHSQKEVALFKRSFGNDHLVGIPGRSCCRTVLPLGSSCRRRTAQITLKLHLLRASTLRHQKEVASATVA